MKYCTKTKYLKKLFITFEGIDRSGKSTQAQKLYKYLKRRKEKVILVREPGGTIISEKIRDILLDKTNKKMFSLTEFLLFSASRHQLTEEIIKPKLKAGYYVICDRYYDSSTAYQGYGGKINTKIIETINKIATTNLKPDISFLIDIDVKERQRRLILSGRGKDRMEAKDISYHKKVISGFRKIARANKKRFRIIDGAKDKEVIHEEIKKTIKI